MNNLNYNCYITLIYKFVKMDYYYNCKILDFRYNSPYALWSVLLCYYSGVEKWYLVRLITLRRPFDSVPRNKFGR